MAWLLPARVKFFSFSLISRTTVLSWLKRGLEKKVKADQLYAGTFSAIFRLEVAQRQPRARADLQTCFVWPAVFSKHVNWLPRVKSLILHTALGFWILLKKRGGGAAEACPWKMGTVPGGRRRVLEGGQPQEGEAARGERCSRRSAATHPRSRCRPGLAGAPHNSQTWRESQFLHFSVSH